MFVSDKKCYNNIWLVYMNVDIGRYTSSNRQEKAIYFLCAYLDYLFYFFGKILFTFSF